MFHASHCCSSRSLILSQEKKLGVLVLSLLGEGTSQARHMQSVTQGSQAWIFPVPGFSQPKQGLLCPQAYL